MRVDVLGVGFDNVTMAEAVDAAAELLLDGRAKTGDAIAALVTGGEVTLTVSSQYTDAV